MIPKPVPSKVFEGDPKFTILKMLKNSARNCRTAHSAPSRPMGVFLIKAISYCWKPAPAKSIAPERAKVALIGAGPAGKIDGNREEGAVVCAAAEVIFANGATGGQVRHGH